MIANNKERNIIHGALDMMYARGCKTMASLVPVGSLILVKSEEDDDDIIYQLMVVYRQSKEVVRCAHFYFDQVEDDLMVAPSDQVVILGDCTHRILSHPPAPTAEEPPQERDLKTQVQTRSNRIVMYRNDKGRENALYITGVRHNSDGQPTSGMVENGGWRIRISNGVAYNGREKLFDVPEFSILYVPVEEVAKGRFKDDNYDRILNWADKVPKEYRIEFATMLVKGKRNESAATRTDA